MRRRCIGRQFTYCIPVLAWGPQSSPCSCWWNLRSESFNLLTFENAFQFQFQWLDLKRPYLNNSVSFSCHKAQPKEIGLFIGLDLKSDTLFENNQVEWHLHQWPLWEVHDYNNLTAHVFTCVQSGWQSFNQCSFRTPSQVWKKVVYVERLLELFRYVPREQLTIPDFIFQ